MTLKIASGDETSVMSLNSVSVSFPSGDGMGEVVHSISFSIGVGERVGLVGESGSGKSLTARAMMHLVPKPGAVTGGAIEISGSTISQTDSKSKWRGSEVAIITQDPLSSLNPLVKIGIQISEMLIEHKGMSKSEANVESEKLLRSVGFPDPIRTMKQYPNSLSGGMRQRVALAIAISCRPKLLIADEPTTSLDVTIQSQVLDLLEKMSTENRMAVLLISHDLAVVSNFCERVIVMYDGRIVESGTIVEIINRPKHPYTQALIASVPNLFDTQRTRLETIPGSPPISGKIQEGCSFAPRCIRGTAICINETPVLDSNQDLQSQVSCHHPIEWGQE